MNLCQYRNVFGAPNNGVHSYRFLNVAIVDVIFTIIAAYMISIFSKYTFLWVSILLFSLGIFFHYIFCVETTVAKILSNVYNYLLTIHHHLLNESMKYIYIERKLYK